jgi:hypothetical protein
MNWPGTDTCDGRRNKRVTLRWIFVLLWLAAAVLLGSGVAKADVHCTTTRYSGMSFTICRYTNPWQPSSTTTCWDDRDYCYTSEGS